MRNKAAIIIFLIVIAIALSACRKGAADDIQNASQAPMPQATDVISDEPVVAPSETGSPTEAVAPEVEAPIAQPEVPAPANISQPTETQQLVEQTEKIVQESRRLVPDFEPKVFVHFIDVGYGDATLIQAPSSNILVDCGGPETGRFVADYLNLAGVDKLDALVLSSPDIEHSGGCDQVLQYYRPDILYDNGLESDTKEYNLLMTTVEDEGIDRLTLHEPLDLALGDEVTARILTPYHGRMAIDNIKDNSLLFKLEYLNVSFLIAGDCRKGCERELLGYYRQGELSAPVLKVGDHGSKDAATELFLDAVMPELSVISTQESPSREIPSPDTLSRLRKYGSRLLRTDYDGHIIVSTDGTAYGVRISRGIEYLDGEGNLSSMAYDDCRFVAHQQSNIYYPTECSFAPNIEPENRMCFTYEGEAVDMGFTRYKWC